MITWKEIQLRFNRAIFRSFSKKKICLVFPFLVLCGLLIVFCHSLAYEASAWIQMSMIFLPIFLSSGILLSLGVLLIRIYDQEIKDLKIPLKDVVKASWEVMIGTSYLAIPPILAYLLLWIILGIFILLKEIPGLGPVIGSVLAFAPFLIILSSILLVVINLGLLFFVSPAVALNHKEKGGLYEKMFRNIRKDIFGNLVFFLLSIFPIIFVVAILSLAALITGLSYLTYDDLLSVVLQWFFIMIPFCLFLTPAVIFFFNFATESYEMKESENR